jgi:molybdate transport system permease protein
LTVHIQTQLPNFQLRVNFQAGSTPLGLLGASGSGKSLTLRSIAGLETPSQGRIVLNGRVLFDAAAGVNLPSRDRKVGLVFQNYALFSHLTVAQNIAFGMAAVPPSQRAAQVVDYLDQMDLSGLGDRYPAQLSGGQQQRVALARALASQPDILLMDEPLSALDTYLRSHIEKRLVEVLARYQGVTLFITHKLEEAYRLCPNLLVLSEGRILAHDTREAIFAHPPSYAVARVTECKNFSRARPVGDGSVEALDWGCQLQVSEPIPPDLMHLGIRAHHLQFAQTLERSKYLSRLASNDHRNSAQGHPLPQAPQRPPIPPGLPPASGGLPRKMGATQRSPWPLAHSPRLQPTDHDAGIANLRGLLCTVKR